MRGRAESGTKLHGTKGSGNIQRKKRDVPVLRKKYGTPEGKKDLLVRLAAERAERDGERELRAQVASRRPDEFHFGYHSMNSKMQRRVCMSADDLRKMLRYIDGEISKYERKRMCGISRSRINKHIKYDDNGQAVVEEGQREAVGATDVSGEEEDSTGSREMRAVGDTDANREGCLAGDDPMPEEDCDGYSSYIGQLLEKRKEAVAKLQALASKKRK